LCGPRGRLASIEHLGSVHDEQGTGVAEGGGAAAGGGRARLHPALALAGRPLLGAAGLTFSVAVSSYR